MICVATLMVVQCPEAFSQGRQIDFDRARGYNERTRNRVFRDSVTPHWFDENQQFWYRVRTGSDTHQYVRVNAIEGRRSIAFDHRRLAEALSAATGGVVEPERLMLSRLRFSDDGRCWFRYASRTWEFTLPAGPIAESKVGLAASERDSLAAESRIVRSRDGGDRTVIQFVNQLAQPLEYVWVMPDGGFRSYGTLRPGKTKQISTFEGHAWMLRNKSGEPVASFVASTSNDVAVIDQETRRPIERTDEPKLGGRNAASNASPDGNSRVSFENFNVFLVDQVTGDRRVLTADGNAQNVYGGRVWWSPDSQHFVVMKTELGQKRVINIVESAPEDSIHSRLLTIPYAKPGDRVDHPQPVLFSADEEWQARPVQDELFSNPFSLRELRWRSDSQLFSFLYNERGHQRLSLISVDAVSASPEIMIDERSDTFICYSGKTFLRRLDSTNEILWMSERSGWNHLYLIDAVTGATKRSVTQGNWVVRGVEAIDQERRQVLLKVSGIDPGQDPYHLHLIRVDLDSGKIVRLTSGDGDHRWEFSPDKQYLIDSYSRVDLPTKTLLRNAETGEMICELEQANISELLAIGWMPPERFVAKGRDGETDIHGFIIRPTNFDPETKYPVVEHIYAGPHSSFVPKRFGLHRQLYEMAELGFVVVKLDGMGTSNRSKAFHDVCWKNLADSGFPDRIAWIKAAAADRPEMDLSRVGIWGGSAGGQSAMRALLAHGDFYHVAVADCGCHDNRVDKIWWNEQWMGWPIGPHYQAQSNSTQAHKLQGSLMLIWGELDRNVDPASTMQVIDALVKADKDFEQLVIPGAGHGAAGHPYAKRRQADFFVRKLWQREPRSE